MDSHSLYFVKTAAQVVKQLLIYCSAFDRRINNEDEGIQNN